jgi:hypothetical protein
VGHRWGAKYGTNALKRDLQRRIIHVDSLAIES